MPSSSKYFISRVTARLLGEWFLYTLMIPTLLLFICISIAGGICGLGISHCFVLDFVGESYLVPSNQEDAQ